MTDPIIKSIDVPCLPERAFEVFVTRISTWWPLGGHSASASSGHAARSITIDPRVGGAVIEIMHDGAQDIWGEVLEFEPGRKLATTWHPGANKDAPTRLDIEFHALPNGHCRVTLTHSGWEIWADRANEMRGNYSTGWDTVFGQCFGPACAV